MPTTLAPIALFASLIAATPAARATPVGSDAPGNAQACSQACLADVMADFKLSVLAKKPVQLADNAEVRENMELTTVERSAWKDVKAIKSSMVFSDTVTGNVISRDGVELLDGKPGYISTRLRVGPSRTEVVDGKPLASSGITEVEISSDLTQANADYVWHLPPILTAVVPEGERSSREALDALAHRYLQMLTDHKGIAADFDDARCNRFHSGNQITNVERKWPEGLGVRTCFTSIDGPKPWGPAVEQRFPVIDVERGIVVGITLLLYSNQVMYVTEISKVEKGRIVHIDNLGLVRSGLEHTTGFGTRR